VPASSPRWRSAFRVGDWIAHPECCRIARAAEERHVPPLIIDLLRLLAQNAGQVVGKEQILDELWEGRFVSESALTRAVAELRGLLGDKAHPPRYIETIPKRGYRLVAFVEPPRQIGLPSLAVLPFDNLTRDHSEEYFADGVTDAIITELGKMATLRVISRQSTLRFKGTQASLREIARDLRVDTVVEGSVQRDGPRVRLTAQLVQADPERHVWAESYDCEMTGVLTVQAQIARQVAASIHAALRPAETLPELPIRRIQPDAHLAYLKGRHLLQSWMQEDVEKGLTYLWQAIQIDPGCAPAYEELAIAMMVLGYFGQLPMAEAFRKAREAALKAVELDPTLSMAHVALGFACWLEDWDLAGCEREFARAIELNPSNGFAYLTRALYTITTRHDVAAMSEDVRQALAVDPLGLHTGFSAAWLWLFARDFDRAAEQAARITELHRDAEYAAFVLSLARFAQGRLAEAIALAEPVARAGGDLFVACLGHLYARAGQPERARAILAELQGRQDHTHGAVVIATVLAGLGENDAAFEALERAYAERDSRLFWLPLVPIYDCLRADPRFPLLMARLAPAPRA